MSQVPDPVQDPQERPTFFHQISVFLKDKFNLDEDKASEDEVKENIRKSVDFKGTNLWVLIFAIVIASVGLNVNSTAVIIGAMLVSPLMGPIMGIGLGLAVNDFELFKRALKNFLWAVAISLVVSTLYFLITPLTTAQSELLARTTPTIWDVLIATFGGLAGIVAQSRKDRTSTVIPGVAIATALMPPLCTAGFGLATGNMAYFGGAFYLFFINTVFIAFSTFFVVRFLKYEKKVFLDKKREKRVKNSIIVIITATLVPSVIMAYSIVQRTLFESNAKLFISEVLSFEGSEVVNHNIVFNSQGNSIEVTMIGEPVSLDAIATARNMLPNYNLTDTKIVVNQASVSGADFDNATITNFLKTNSDILVEKNRQIAQLEDKVQNYSRHNVPTREIVAEITSLWPEVQKLSIAKTPTLSPQGTPLDTITMCMISISHPDNLTQHDKQKLTAWLKVRTKSQQVKLIIEQNKEDTTD